MAYYILIRGALGVGKTTIARKLADNLDGEYISIDKTLKENNLDIVKGEECIPADRFIKANEIVLPKAKEKLSKGKIVIFDGAFYNKEQIKHLIQNLSEQHYVFTLKAPIKVCIERDSKRKMWFCYNFFVS